MEWIIFLYPEGYEKTVLNSDDQQNKQPPQIIDHKKKTTTDDVGNPDPRFGQAQKCGAVKPVNGTPPPLLMTVSSTAIQI